MKYEFVCNLEEYKSYLENSIKLSKRESFFSMKLKLYLVLICVLLNTLAAGIGSRLLTCIVFVITIVALLIVLALTSKKTLLKFVGPVSKMAYRKLEKTITLKRVLTLDNEKVVYEVGESSFTINLGDIKDIIVDDYCIFLKSYGDSVGTFLSKRVFRDKEEMEEFINRIETGMQNKSEIVFESDYSYSITADDYANYLEEFSANTGINSKMNRIVITFLVITGLIYVPHFMKESGLVFGLVFAFLLIIIYVFYLVGIKSKTQHKRYIKQAKIEIVRKPELLNLQQIKMEEDYVVLYSNRTIKKYYIKDIVSASIRNGTVVVLGKSKQLNFMMPCSVFETEDEMNKFIGKLSK
ncbi:hypothetical protein UT300012_23420 [Paraclostridium bifermentans]